MSLQNNRQYSESTDLEELLDKDSQRALILHNDDVNTFDFVIDTLIEVCEHDPEQAEQCTFIVHYKGKCDVKKGSFTKLRPVRQELVRRGLTATID